MLYFARPKSQQLPASKVVFQGNEGCGEAHSQGKGADEEALELEGARLMYIEPVFFGLAGILLAVSLLAYLLLHLWVRERRLSGWRDFVRFVYDPATYKAAKEISKGFASWPHGWDVVVRCMKSLGAGQYPEVKRMIEGVNSKISSKLGVSINIVWDAPVHGSIKRL